MSSEFILFFLIIIFLWLFILTYFLWKNSSHYSKLTEGIKEKNFKFLMEKLLTDVNIAKKDIDNLKAYCNNIQKEGQLHIQKIGLVRFNPFKDTGGDQSFIISLVDGNDTGVIISGLYARSGTRWYAKKVVKGKSLDHDLTDEEKRSLSQART